MRRGLTSQSVVDFVAASGVASEKQILEWAKSSPAATVQMLLRKCEREGALKSRKVEENTVLFWAPAAQETAASQQVEARAQEPSADKVEEEIAALLWVNDVYDKEVKGHMERLHVYNETKDTAVDVIGRVAAVESVTVKSLYEKYGIEVTD